MPDQRALSGCSSFAIAARAVSETDTGVPKWLLSLSSRSVRRIGKASFALSFPRDWIAITRTSRTLVAQCFEEGGVNRLFSTDLAEGPGHVVILLFVVEQADQSGDGIPVFELSKQMDRIVTVRFYLPLEGPICRREFHLAFRPVRTVVQHCRNDIEAAAVAKCGKHERGVASQVPVLVLSQRIPVGEGHSCRGVRRFALRLRVAARRLWCL